MARLRATSQVQEARDFGLKWVGLSERRWNFADELVQLVSDLDEVLSRPPRKPVRSGKQAQRRLEPAEVAELIASYRGGDSMNQLAKCYGIHRTTVAHWLRENAVELRRHGVPDEELPVIVRLYSEGWSCQRLAQRYDCDDETVRQALKRSGIELRRPWERP